VKKQNDQRNQHGLFSPWSHPIPFCGREREHTKKIGTRNLKEPEKIKDFKPAHGGLAQTVQPKIEELPAGHEEFDNEFLNRSTGGEGGGRGPEKRRAGELTSSLLKKSIHQMVSANTAGPECRGRKHM